MNSQNLSRILRPNKTGRKLNLIFVMRLRHYHQVILVMTLVDLPKVERMHCWEKLCCNKRNIRKHWMPLTTSWRVQVSHSMDSHRTTLIISDTPQSPT